MFGAKKSLFLMFIFGVLLSSFLASFAVAAEKGDVAYVYSKNFLINFEIVRAFEDLGLKVDLVQVLSIRKNFAGYKMAYINDEFFRNPSLLPMGEVPTIVGNYYHGFDLGLTDNEGVSSLGANAPLSVITNNQVLQVYTRAVDRVAIPYYFLDDDNAAPGIRKIAGTFVGSNGEDLGSVIGYANASTRLLNGKVLANKLCFFGIIKAQYWTPAAKQLFNECVGFVAASCFANSDCAGSGESANFCSGKNVVKNVTMGVCRNPGTIQSSCGVDATQVLLENCTDYCEGGTCKPFVCHNDLECADADDHTFDTCLNANTTQSQCVHQPIACLGDSECNDLNQSTADSCVNPGTTLSECVHEPIVCFSDAQCGSDGFVGDSMCVGLNVTREFIDYQCLHPGTKDSFCTNSTDRKTVQQCTEGCDGGVCLDVLCRNDSDCDDNSPLTLDACVNPGTLASRCEYTPINCASNSDCGTTGFIGEEFCSVNQVVKNFQSSVCHNPGGILSFCSVNVTAQQTNLCQYACSGGACVRCDSQTDCDDGNNNTADSCVNPGNLTSSCLNVEIISQTIVCSSDAQCGSETTVGALYCAGNTVNKNVLTFDCINEGTPQSYCTNTSETRSVQQCSDYCSGGLCQSFVCSGDSACDDGNSNTIDRCVQGGTPGSSCTHTPQTPSVACSSDAQCGSPFVVGNNFCSAGSVKQIIRTPICVNPGTAASSCSSRDDQQTVQQCASGCSGGVCVSAACSSDAQCSDNNPLTLDACVNPGTGASSCSHVGINCASNSDCGTTGFIGQEFCSLDDVFKNRQTATCVNPGTGASSCQISVVSERIQDCSGSCTAGSCIVCSSNAQCSDGNSNTVDTCVNPGTAQSRCEYTLAQAIACSSASECGVNDFVGAASCSANSVVQSFRTFSCVNPGTSGSFCTSSSVVQTKAVCLNTEQCVTGTCHPIPTIACSNDAQCVDGNSNTVDRCVNPGTPGSRCEHTAQTIRCTLDQDCGLTGFVGVPACSQKAIVQSYKIFSCINRGTPESFCTNSNQVVVKSVCSDACQNGACTSFVCHTDLECSDGNDHTFDRCVNSNTSTSSCTHTPIACLGDSACDDGNAGTVDRCLNAGTPSSSCTNVCTVPVEEAVMVINVSFVGNYNAPRTTGADMSNRVFVGGAQKGRGIVSLPLTEDQESIVDSVVEDVPGLAVARGVNSFGSYVLFSAFGGNHPDSRETIRFNIRLENSTIVRLENQNSGYENPFDDVCGIWLNDLSRSDNKNDEMVLQSNNVARFCSITNTDSDSVKVYYDASALKAGC